jgi:hypothetical protein
MNVVRAAGALIAGRESRIVAAIQPASPIGRYRKEIVARVKTDAAEQACKADDSKSIAGDSKVAVANGAPRDWLKGPKCPPNVAMQAMSSALPGHAGRASV